MMRNYNRKKYRGKKRSYNRYKRKSKYNTAYSLARRAISMASGERKYIDTDDTAYTVTNTGTVIQLCNLVQGNDNLTRIGDTIKVDLITCTMKWLIDSSAVYTTCRVMLVLDKQSNGAIFNVSNVLEYVNVASHREKNGRRRFYILYDKIFSLDPISKTSYVLHFTRRLNTILTYTGNLGTAADLTNKNFGIVILSDRATLQPTVDYYCRLRFTDK